MRDKALLDDYFTQNPYYYGAVLYAAARSAGIALGLDGSYQGANNTFALVSRSHGPTTPPPMPLSSTLPKAFSSLPNGMNARRPLQDPSYKSETFVHDWHEGKHVLFIKLGFFRISSINHFENDETLGTELASDQDPNRNPTMMATTTKSRRSQFLPHALKPAPESQRHPLRR
ncbi:uncharacterized protein Z520_03223 [Fonsecaea multimorphosa CBS 102226]|uniref:Uncharacterized protein n=1 Tax=Fonsecaea multimorphosa CBS 102226 TaxID=1442371 RepID=A0A0D2KBU7_9EURO|nr:uncharacterized protein Z520_03223 [Fonsecaea multimorphosa CBS 102226]KIY00560.1 hypothetical protein Z520_03223 [Fonsecaea multimorphosa CBS 102226]